MIYQARDYICKEIAKVPYLVPYAQKICDRARLLRLNATGEDIWNAVGSGISKSALFDRLASQYGIPDSERTSFDADITAFCDMLRAHGALTENETDAALPAPAYTPFCSDTALPAPLLQAPKTDLRAAGLTLALALPPSLLHPSFSDFLHPHTEPEAGRHTDCTYQRVTICNALPSVALPHPLIADPLLTLYPFSDGYLYHHPQNRALMDMFVSTDGTRCLLFCEAPEDEALPEEIFFALRESFLLLAAQNGLYCLHSASILYQDRALLFSGPSGMGKSTHTGLWNRFEHTTYINGDLNLLAIEDGAPVIKGIPWCGTSGICDDETHPVDAIVLLGRGDNRILPLTTDEQITGIFQRITSPRFDCAQTLALLSFTEKYCRLVKVRKLICDISETAVQTIKAAL